MNACVARPCSDRDSPLIAVISGTPRARLPCPNGIKLSGDGHQPEDDPGQRGQPGGLAGLAGLVPAAGPLGLALVAAAGALGHEVAGEGDLEGQVGGEVVEAVRGKSIRSR